MRDFTVNRFRGSLPRVAQHLITPGTAKRALDCKLTSGQLDSFRQPLLVREPEAGTLTTYLHGCCWIDFDSCVDVAVGPVTCKKIFITGYRDYPISMETKESDCSIIERRLGLPCPDRAPSIFPGVVDPNRSAPKDIEGRSYAYQYRDDEWALSALSPGSRAVNLHDGQTVVVSGWQQPDPTWGATHVRIFRTVTGHQSGNEAANVPDTTWMYVGEVAINAGSFTDTLYNDELLVALEEDVATPPPANLKGIVWIESINSLAGFVGNRIYFSENNKYDHWPHFMDLDDNICAIAESNGLIYVATDGRPYIISGAVDCKNAGCRSAVRLPGNFPMIGCGTRRMAAVAAGAVYPSLNGMVLMSGKSAPLLMTWGRYSPEDWQAMMPESATPVEVGGKLYVFMQNGAFVFTFAGGPEGGWDMDDHSELSDRGVIDAFVTRTGDFYLLKEDGLWQWDRGNDLRPHEWESNEHVTSTPVAMGAGHLHFDFGAENVKIEVNGREALNREVKSSRVFRLPMWASGTRWTFTLTGTGRVSLLSISPSMADLG